MVRSSKDGRMKWMDTYEFEGPYITVGNRGFANFNLIQKFNAPTHTLVYDTIKSLPKNFIYYSILQNKDLINDLCFQ